MCEFGHELVGHPCRTRWDANDVRLHRTGVKHFRHPAVGELTLNFEAMELSGDDGLALTAYTADPDTLSAERLQLLANWAATNKLVTVQP